MMEDRSFVLMLMAISGFPGLISLVVVRFYWPLRGRARHIPWHGILIVSLICVLMLTAHLPSTH